MHIANIRATPPDLKAGRWRRHVCASYIAYIKLTYTVLYSYASIALVETVYHDGLTFLPYTARLLLPSPRCTRERVVSSLMLPPHIDISAVRYEPLITHCDRNYTRADWRRMTRRHVCHYYYAPKITDDDRIFALYNVT